MTRTPASRSQCAGGRISVAASGAGGDGDFGEALLDFGEAIAMNAQVLKEG